MKSVFKSIKRWRETGTIRFDKLKLQIELLLREHTINREISSFLKGVRSASLTEHNIIIIIIITIIIIMIIIIIIMMIIILHRC